MYNKEQLEAMEPIQLMEIALSMGVSVSPESSKENVIYDILDKAAIDTANSQTEKPKRKYTRKAKPVAEEVVAEAKDTAEAETQSTETPKRRGRKPKAEKAEEAATEEKPKTKKKAKKEATEEQEAAQAATAENS